MLLPPLWERAANLGFELVKQPRAAIRHLLALAAFLDINPAASVCEPRSAGDKPIEDM